MSQNDKILIGIFGTIFLFSVVFSLSRNKPLVRLQYDVLLTMIISVIILWNTKGVVLAELGRLGSYFDAAEVEAAAFFYGVKSEIDITGFDRKVYVLLIIILMLGLLLRP